MHKKVFLKLAACIGAYFALWILVPKAVFLPLIINSISAIIPFINGSAGNYLQFIVVAAMSAPTVAFMAISIAIIYYFAALKLSFKQSILSIIICIGTTFGLIAIVIQQLHILPKLGHYPNLSEHLYILAHYFGPFKMPISVLLMLAAASIGYAVSLRVTDKNLILPVVMFAAYIDFWTVTRGPVASALQHAPKVVEAVSAPIPQVGAGSFVPSTVMGPGDSLFMCLVFAAVLRHKMNGPRNYLFIFLFMTLGMLAVMTGLLPWLPALITLALAVMTANWREFSLSRQEKISMAIVAVLLFGTLPLVWSLLKPHVEKKVAPQAKPAVSAPANRR